MAKLLAPRPEVDAQKPGLWSRAETKLLLSLARGGGVVQGRSRSHGRGGAVAAAGPLLAAHRGGVHAPVEGAGVTRTWPRHG